MEDWPVPLGSKQSFHFKKKGHECRERTSETNVHSSFSEETQSERGMKNSEGDALSLTS
jgi:hypothetical protein